MSVPKGIMAMKPIASRRGRRESGAALVEFALVASVFLMVLIGIMEFGRMLFTWNSAAEATRWGARLAVVCEKNDPVIRQKMKLILGQLQDTNIVIAYCDPVGSCSPTNTCDVSTCKGVKVSISGYSFRAFIPFMNINVAIPPFSTTLLRERMGPSVTDPGEADVCK